MPQYDLSSLALSLLLPMWSTPTFRGAASSNRAAAETFQRVFVGLVETCAPKEDMCFEFALDADATIVGADAPRGRKPIEVTVTTSGRVSFAALGNETPCGLSWQLRQALGLELVLPLTVAMQKLGAETKMWWAFKQLGWALSILLEQTGLEFRAVDGSTHACAAKPAEMEAPARVRLPGDGRKRGGASGAPHTTSHHGSFSRRTNLCRLLWTPRACPGGA